MMDFRHCRDSRFSAAAARALLDSNRWGDAVNGVDIGFAGGLNNGACVGIQGLKIAPLTLVEKDIKGQG